MRTVDLWYYLPPILKNFLEMKEIMKAEEPEFQIFANNLDDLAKDSFITEATAKGISRFEQMLKIYPSAGASLETRRSAVLTKWWDVTPYTIRTLRNRIVVIQGNDNVQISFAEDDPFRIQIVTRLENPGQVDDLDYILTTMLPANLIIDAVNRIEINSDITPFYGLGATLTGSLFLTNDLTFNMALDVSHRTGIGAGFTNTLFLTNDLDASVTQMIPHKVAVGMSETNTLFLTNDLNEIVELGLTAHPAIGSGYTNFIEN